MLLAEVRVPGLSHKAGKLADALILLALAWVLFIGCVHKFPVRLSSESFQGYGIKGIFRDDFPFSISSKTPDLGTAIPPAREGCSVKILPYGPENFALRAELMKSARSYIYLQNYIFANDSTGQASAGIFKEKIGQGVAVYLIVDGYNKLGNLHRELYKQMVQNGVKIAGFEPKYMSFLNQNYVPTTRELNMRYHEKYLIVDGVFGITGGTNIGDSYAGVGAKPGTELRDQDVLVTGAVVEDMERAFEENFGGLKLLESSRPVFLKRNKTRLESAFKGRRDIGIQVPEGISFTDQDVRVRLIRSRPRYEESYIYQAYLYLIQQAQKGIIIENSYYIPDKDLNDAILNAARRGVEVTMIVDVGKARDKLQMQPIIIRHYYLPLVEAGVKVYEWQSTLRGEGELHSKVSVFDGQVSVIGSYNFDPRCKYLNSEDVVVIDSEKTAAALTDYIFQNDLIRSELVSLEKAKANRYPKEITKFIRLTWALMVKDYW